MDESGRQPGESRRDFMRESMRRLARWGIEATGKLPKPGPAPAKPPPSDSTPAGETLELNYLPDRMAYRRLGRTGLLASRFVLGGAAIRPANLEVVRRAVELGVNLIETALHYPESETALAPLLPEIRDRVWLCSRTAPLDEGGEGPATEFWESLESSLSRLNVDTIDLYLLQGVDDPDVLRDDGLQEAIERAREQGMIRHGGIAVRANVQNVVHEALNIGAPFDAIVAPVHALNLAEMGPQIDRAQRLDIALIGDCFATGLVDFALPGPLSLYDLPEELDAEQLAWLYLMRHSPQPAAIATVDSIDRLERLTPLTRMELTPEAERELNSIVEDELWPACASCGERRGFAREDLEAYHAAGEAALDRTAASGAAPRRDPAEFFSLCETCRAEPPPDES